MLLSNSSCTKTFSKKVVAAVSDQRNTVFLGQSKYETSGSDVLMISSGACVVSCPDPLREEMGHLLGGSGYEDWCFNDVIMMSCGASVMILS